VIVSTRALAPKKVVYPETDGLPIAENIAQFRWIVTIKEGIEAMLRDDPNVFVAGDLFWYPVEGDPKTVTALDALVVFGRPKGDRRSYLQWEEGGVAPQVVFEVLSPGNRFEEMLRKFRFYERFGVEEYYIYDPDYNGLEGWRRVGERLEQVDPMNGWTSPRLGLTFEWTDDGLRLLRPDGRPLETYLELSARAEAERERAEEQSRRAERLAAQLRAMGIEPEAG
jgi:Uma2 family endonuclease